MYFYGNRTKRLLVTNRLMYRVLLLGPGGCNKHLLLEYCLKNLQKEHETEATSKVVYGVVIDVDAFDPSEYITIRLDGDYVENDDDAFRIIARHLTSPTMRRWFGI